MFELKEFQKRAVEDSQRKITRIRKQPATQPRRFLLNAGCGGGKTVMLAYMLTNIAKDDLTIVVTPGAGSLAEQTFNSLRKNMPAERKVIHVTSPTDLDGAEPGTVYVTNYEKLVTKHGKNQKDGKGGQYKSKVTADGENFNWWDMLTQAKNADTEVVVAVDEAHYGSRTSTGAIQKFFRDMTDHLGYVPFRVETTATPNREVGESLFEGEVRIDRADLVECGLTREEIILNSDYSKFENAFGSDEDIVLMELMWEKWIRARKMTHEQNRHTPLMTFCLANDNKGGIEGRDKIVEFLKTKTDPVTGLPLTTDNGTVAVHLSGEKANVGEMGSMASKSSPVVALIFKQAIALGWDCPRAQFMMVTRDVISEAFTMQLLGRLLRQPTAEATGDDLLDKAYVYAAVDRSFTIPSGLSGILAEDTTRREMFADTGHLELWKNFNLRSRRNVRTDRGGKLTAGSVLPQIANMKVAPTVDPATGVSKRVSDATVMDGIISADEFFQGSIFSGVARRQVVNLLTDKMRARDIGPAVRAAEYCETALEAWAKSQDHEWFKNFPWETMIVNSVIMEPVYSKLVEHAYTETQNRDRYVDGEWEQFVPAVSRFINEDHALGAKVNQHKDYVGVMARSHLYGTPAAHKTSKSEVQFENNLFGAKTIENYDAAEFKVFSDTVVSWFKNEDGHTVSDDGKASHATFTLTYKTGRKVVNRANQEVDEYANMKPDYLVLTKRPDGSYKAWVFEVKGEGFQDGSGDSSRFRKAATLAQYRENGASGAAVYCKEGVWMIVTSETDGDLNEEPLLDWIARQN